LASHVRANISWLTIALVSLLFDGDLSFRDCADET
jgi:hypothetical protein